MQPAGRLGRLELTTEGYCVFRSSRSSHGHPVDFDGRDAYPHRHALAFLAAHSDAFIEMQVVAHHADVLQRFRPVADETGVAHRARQLTTLDEITFRSRKDEVAAGNIHLPAAEIRAVEALRHRPDNLLRVAFP